MNRKDYTRPIMILTVLTVVFTILGSTFAWLSWRSSTNTLVTFTVTPDFSCSVDGGGDITSDDVSIIPTTCTNSDHAIMREVTTSVTNSSGLNVFMDLWLDVEEMGTGLSNSQNFRYALTTSETSCSTGVVASGTFNGKAKDSKVTLLDEEAFSSNSTDKYYLYIWLDSAETSTSTMNQNFSLSLNGSCTNDGSVKASKPVLDNTGMIPVTISNDGVVTTVSEDDSNWYNYEDKEWANAILVSESSRSSYLGTTGVPVMSSDILAYYVWIPKYSYKMNGTEESISISWNYNETGYTKHPAFKFDGEEIDGFWTGKFETTGSATTPTVLPNVQSLRSQNVSTQFTTSLKFAGGTLTDGTTSFAGSKTYGLSSTTDSHMMKNSEWGAVTYLSHSEYGIDSEIYINNSGQSSSSGYYTGRSGGNVGGSNNTLATQFPDDSTSSNRYNYYGYYTWLGQEIDVNGSIGDFASDRTLGTKASTTGNVTGVYDMSGGAYEYVMGVFANSNGDLWTGYSSSSNSGFTGLYGSSGTEYTGIKFPEDKYFDTYRATSGTTISATTACSGGVCYGHALSETSGWYGDYAYFVDSSFPWF